jgi:hypothetical protein
MKPTNDCGCEYEPHNTLEQKREVIQMNTRITQQHICNGTYVHDLINRSQGETMVNANQLLSSLEVLSHHYVNHYTDDVMSISRDDCTVNESPACVGGDEAPQNDEGLGESITHIEVPDQSLSESDLVNTNVSDQSNEVQVEEKDTTSNNKQSSDTDKSHDYMMATVPINTSEVAYPNEDEGITTPDDSDGNDTCENGCIGCLSTCYYCRGF